MDAVELKSKEGSEGDKPEPKTEDLVAVLGEAGKSRWRPSDIKMVKANKLKQTAEWMRSLARIDRDRRFSMKRFKFLADQMVNGKLHMFRWMVAKLPDGTLIRVNGNHGTKLVEVAPEIPDYLAAVVETYEVDNYDAAVELWSTIDAQRSSRTSSEIIAPLASLSKKLSSYQDATLVTVGKGLAYANYGDAASTIDAAQRAGLMLEDDQLSTFLADIVRGDRYQFMRRMGVLGAIARCYKKNKADAKKFAYELRDGTTNAMIQVCRDWLMNTNVRSGLRSRQTKDGAAEPREHCFRVLKSWNVWRRNPDIKLEDAKNEFKYSAKWSVPEAE